MSRNNKISSAQLRTRGTTPKISSKPDIVLQLEAGEPQRNVFQQPGASSSLAFLVPSTGNPQRNRQDTSGIVRTVATNITQNFESYDFEFSLGHRKNGDSISTPNTRMILSSGREDENNQNKLILLNPYESDGDLNRKSSLVYRGFQSTKTITGDAQGGSGTTITLASGSSAVDDYYNGYTIEITSGDCNKQFAIIKDYVGTTKVATINKTWSNSKTPALGDSYTIHTHSNLAEIEVAHKGTGSDDKGIMNIKVNDGNGDTPESLTTILSLSEDTVTISGNLDVTGQTTTVSSTNTTIQDTLIKLAHGSTTGTEVDASTDIGLVFTRGDGANTNIKNKAFIWDESLEAFAFVASDTNDATGTETTINGYEKLQIYKLHLTALGDNGSSLSDEHISSDGTDMTIASGGKINLSSTGAVVVPTDKKIQFRDSDIYLNSSSDGQLDIAADGETQIVAPIVDINASTGIALDGANLNSSWTVNSNNKIQFRDTGIYLNSSSDGQLDVAADTIAVITAPTTTLASSTAINLTSNALNIGDNTDNDIVLTFNANTSDGVVTWKEDEDYFLFSDDLLISGDEKIQFRDTDIYLNSSSDGQLDIVADVVTITGDLSVKDIIKNPYNVISFDDDIITTQNNIFAKNINTSIIENNTWKQLGSTIDAEAASDRFGTSVDISYDGKIIAIGAPYNDSTDGSDTQKGSVRVYYFNETNQIWTQKGVDIDGTATSDQSGSNLSLSGDGNTLCIGAKNHDSSRGHVIIYKWNGTAWASGVEISGSDVGDNFGVQSSLSADGNTVAISSPNHDSIKGTTRIYTYDSGAWSQKGSDIDGEGANDKSGSSISLSANGNIVAIGAPGDDDGGSNAGNVRVYKWNGSSWAQIGSDINGDNVDDALGDDLSISLSADGFIVAVGAKAYNSNQGYIKVLKYNGSSWSQLGSNINGDAGGDKFGTAVSINASGNIIAASADNTDGLAYTKLYKFDGISWNQLGTTITSDGSGDATKSNALSADGKILVIGAPLHDSNKGHVRVFSYGNFQNNLTTGNLLEARGQFSANTGGTFGSFSGSDTSPSVANGNLWKTDESSQTLIDFDEGVAGQTITVISAGAVIYDVTTGSSGYNLKGGSTNITTASGDITVWTYDGTSWYLVQFMDQSSNMVSDSLDQLTDVAFSTTSNSLYLGTGTSPPTNIGADAVNNTSIGVGALTSINSSSTTNEADNNTSVGYNAGNSITTGYQNTCIGSGSSTSAAAGFNQTSIGYGASCDDNNQITLGSGSIQKLRCSTSVIATLSDRRDKKDIEDCSYGEEFINKVKPRKFTWNKRVLGRDDENFSKNGKDELGFIAQEMQEAMEGENKELLNLVSETNPERLEIQSGNLLPIMVKALQEMSSKIKDLEAEIKVLKQV